MLAINVPADGLFLAVQNKAAGDYSKENCERIIRAYIGKMLEAKPDVILLNACYRRALTPSEVFDSYLYDVETDSDGYACRDAEGKSIKTLSPVSENVSKYFASFFKCARAFEPRDRYLPNGDRSHPRERYAGLPFSAHERRPLYIAPFPRPFGLESAAWRGDIENFMVM